MNLVGLAFFLFFIHSIQAQCLKSYVNYAIDGQNLTSVRGASSACCTACQNQAGCLAYTWTNDNGGTCWLKNDTQPMYPSNLALTVMMAPTPDRTYSLNVSYDSSNFFDVFDFKTTNYGNGFVNFTDKQTSQNIGIAKIIGNQIFLGTDNTTVLPWNATKGRNTIRLESYNTFNSGLFIFSVDHLPEAPGVWPAFWTYGPNWPDDGEIDILESISEYTWNQITLHTNEGCEMSVNDSKYFTGTWVLQNKKPGTNCWNNAPGQYTDAGCSIAAPNGTFDPGFNQAGGGVYAMEWDNKKFIRIWNFVKPNVPADITNNSPNPNPDTWGLPTAYFRLGDNCLPKHFQKQTVTINTALCGFAGQFFPGGGECKCENTVRFAPQLYTDAYFLINYVKVFCRPGDACRHS